MRWKTESLLEKKQRLMSWHKIFAWTPVRLNNGERAWLEFVEQRLTYQDSAYGSEIVMEYRAV